MCVISPAGGVWGVEGGYEDEEGGEGGEKCPHGLVVATVCLLFA